MKPMKASYSLPRRSSWSPGPAHCDGWNLDENYVDLIAGSTYGSGERYDHTVHPAYGMVKGQEDCKSTTQRQILFELAHEQLQSYRHLKRIQITYIIKKEETREEYKCQI
jgi:hypothetical protein